MKRRLGYLLLFAGVPFFLAVLARSTQEDEYWVHRFEHRQLTDEFFCEGASFGDLSGDGMEDLVAGPFWFEGPDFNKKHTFYEAKSFSIEGYSACFFSFVYDFDQDSHNDILVIGFPGEEASWYKNPGPSGDFWQRHIVFNGVDNESPTFGDLTGDGKPELIFLHGGMYGYAEPDWANPAKPWPFTAVTEDRGLTKYTHGLGYGDVNGDGRQDLLEAKGWYEQTTEGLWKRHEINFAVGGAQMFAYDFDGDGDNDVITSNMGHAWGLQWHENNGDGSFAMHKIMGETPAGNRYGVAFSQLHALALVDIDGDGIKDILTGKRYWAHMGKDPGGNQSPVLYWFKTMRMEDGSVDFIPYFINDATGVGTQLIVSDYNNDDLPDFVVSNKKGIAVYTHSKEKVDQATWQAMQPVPVSN